MIKYNSKGFTLIELLVVTAIVGVLAVLSATVFNSILKSQNKTAVINEARQNGDLAMDKFERDIKQASNVTFDIAIPTKVEIELDGPDAIWRCDDPIIGEITRDYNGSVGSVLNQDAITGIKLIAGSCKFTVRGTGQSQLVTWEFDLTQRRTSAGKAEFEIEVPFRTSVGTRATR